MLYKTDFLFLFSNKISFKQKQIRLNLEKREKQYKSYTHLHHKHFSLVEKWQTIYSSGGEKKENSHPESYFAVIRHFRLYSKSKNSSNVLCINTKNIFMLNENAKTLTHSHSLNSQLKKNHIAYVGIHVH